MSIDERFTMNEQQVVNLMRDRVMDNVNYRLGNSDKPDTPIIPPKLAADELYAKQGARAAELPDGGLLEYLAENGNRLSRQLERIKQFGI